MDTFFEQIVTIKIDAKKLLAIGAIWFFAIALCVGILVLSIFVPTIQMIMIVSIVGIVFLAYKLCQNFFIEYEYIVTNTDLDIDTIIARNKRKRLITIDITQISSFTKYDEKKYVGRNFTTKYFCCNTDDELYAIEYKHRNQGNVLLVFAPNKKIITAINKSAPRTVVNI